jgi:hypothetical protein
MPRNQVDDNKDNTCSAGLHFCSFDYLKSFGGSRIMILKINPADVVSIPSDYNQQKGRTWRYTVIGEVPAEERDENILVKTAVDTRFSRFDGSLERVFEKLTQSEKRTIANHFGYGFYSTDDLLDILLQEYTYTEIRTALRRLLG